MYLQMRKKTYLENRCFVFNQLCVDGGLLTAFGDQKWKVRVTNITIVCFREILHAEREKTIANCTPGIRPSNASIKTNFALQKTLKIPNSSSKLRNRSRQSRTS